MRRDKDKRKDTEKARSEKEKVRSDKVGGECHAMSKLFFPTPRKRERGRLWRKDDEKEVVDTQ